MARIPPVGRLRRWPGGTRTACRPRTRRRHPAATASRRSDRAAARPRPVVEPALARSRATRPPRGTLPRRRRQGDRPVRAVAEGHGDLAAGAAGPDRAAAGVLPGIPRRRPAHHRRSGARDRAGPLGERLSGQPSRPGSAPTGVRSAPATRPSRDGANLRLGYLTPEGRGVQLRAEQRAGGAAAPRRADRQGQPQGPTELAGRTWQLYTARGNQQALVLLEPTRTVIVVGDARDNELRELAGSLR